MSGVQARAFAGALDAAVEAEAWGLDQAQRLGFTPKATYAMSLCLEELFVNAVQHGAAQEIRVALTPDTLEFRDDGVAFDPSRAPQKRLHGPDADFEVGGFGLGLVQKFADQLSYRREGEWNVVRLAFGAGAR